MDGLVYASLAPRGVVSIMEQIRPMQMPRRKTFQGVGHRTVLTVLGMTVLVSVQMYTHILPNTDKITLTRDYLCKGDVQFTYSKHPALGPMFWMDASSSA